MSKFFKALEQAEREHALQEEARRHEDRKKIPPAQSPLPIDRPRSVPQRGPLRLAQAVIPKGGEPSKWTDEHLVSVLKPGSYEAEQYLMFRHVLEQMHQDESVSVVAVTSPTVRDGKTTTAINLAGAMAQASRGQVLLIDTDLAQSAVAEYLGIEMGEAPGLTEAIQDPDLALDDIVRRSPLPNLFVVPGGRCPTARYEAIISLRLGELIRDARKGYDYVVLDTPPLVRNPDCRAIAKWVDGFLIVVTAHKTPRTLLEESLNALEPGKVLGLVFNGDDRRRLEGYPQLSQARNGNRAARWGR